MGQTQRVTDLMCRELAETGKRHLLHFRRNRLPLFVGGQETLGDEVVLPHSQGTECHVPLDDLTGARVRDNVAHRPPARRPMNPLDHIIAYVHRIGICRQHLHPESIDEAGRFKGLGPPASAGKERGADRLGRGRIEVINDGLHRLAERGRRILLLQPVPRDELVLKRSAQRGRIIRVAEREVTGARVVGPRDEAGRRKLHKRVAGAHCHGSGIGRHIAYPFTRLATGKSKSHLDLGVLRKVLGMLE